MNTYDVVAMLPVRLRVEADSLEHAGEQAKRVGQREDEQVTAEGTLDDAAMPLVVGVYSVEDES